MLLKISGCLLVIAATTLAGMARAGSIQEQYRQMKYLQRILYMIESEIRYSHTYLGEIFLNVSRRIEEPYKGWLLSMERKMGQMDSGAFEVIWGQAAEDKLKHCGLPHKELERLIQLGSQLGAMDLNLQLKVLSLYQEQLKLSMEEIQEGMKTKVRLCHCLGVMSGLLVAVLLL
ncbi:MAG: hypothetical protein HFH03_11030 [Dorea sp.]|jgi:stage III sporulation protein AB|nr:hypothetical protein [Dorea sp.]